MKTLLISAITAFTLSISPANAIGDRFTGEQEYSVGEWEVFEGYETMSDKPYIMISKMSETSGIFGAPLATLSFRCLDKEPALRIAISSIDVDDMFTQHRLFFRIDKGEVEEFTGIYDHSSGLISFIQIDGVEDFANRLYAADTLAVQYDNVVAKINLSDIKEAISGVAEQCEWTQ